jgi:hypothetical protein
MQSSVGSSSHIGNVHVLGRISWVVTGIHNGMVKQKEDFYISSVFS